MDRIFKRFNCKQSEIKEKKYEIELNKKDIDSNRELIEELKRNYGDNSMVNEKITKIKNRVNKLTNDNNKNKRIIDDLNEEIKILEGIYIPKLKDNLEIVGRERQNQWWTDNMKNQDLSELERAFQNYVDFYRDRITVSNNVLHDNLEILKNMIISPPGIDGWANH